MPAVAGFKKQGANNGACLAFLISAPETGVDSLALTYSLLGPFITIVRPIAAFVTSFVAGILENFTGSYQLEGPPPATDRLCLVDGCCDGVGCDPAVHARHHTMLEKLRAGLSFAFNDLMDDLARWFVLGVVLAGIITAVVPDSFFDRALGTGLVSYLAMLAIGLPMYVCASASTPIAAALILKGLSPGAALVFLLAGPATNVATLTMVGGMLGKRTTAIYLSSIVVCSVGMGYLTDLLHHALPISTVVAPVLGHEGLVPEQLEWAAAVVLIVLIVRSWLRSMGKDLPTGS